MILLTLSAQSQTDTAGTARLEILAGLITAEKVVLNGVETDAISDHFGVMTVISEND
ncbi:MAG: hypothetical protein AB9907_09355 [Flexilinea sp.]